MTSSSPASIRLRSAPVQKGHDCLGDLLWPGPMLDEFGNDFPAGDNVGHAEMFYPNE